MFAQHHSLPNNINLTSTQHSRDLIKHAETECKSNWADVRQLFSKIFRFSAVSKNLFCNIYALNEAKYKGLLKASVIDMRRPANLLFNPDFDCDSKSWLLLNCVGSGIAQKSSEEHHEMFYDNSKIILQQSTNHSQILFFSQRLK